jgi:hypothetical protein
MQSPILPQGSKIRQLNENDERCQIDVGSSLPCSVYWNNRLLTALKANKFKYKSSR